jgi:glycosyltransferase involved in cell wall biosynthesis
MMDKSIVKLSVLIPAFNEEDSIRELVPEVISVLQDTVKSFEVIVIDDGSYDNTESILKDLLEKFPEHLVAIQHLDNKGNGASLRTGINAARGDIVVTMDADGQHVPADILKLLDLIPPYDLVIAARTKNYQGNWYRGFANSFFNVFSSWLSQHKILDLTSGFRAMHRHQVMHFLTLFPNGFSAPTTTTMAFLKAGYNVTFIPIDVHQRQSGQSKISLIQDGYRFIMIIIRMIMLFDPMRIFLPAGVLFGILGISAWIAGLINAQRLVIPNSTILFFSSALLTMLLGLISDQIAGSRIEYQGDETVIIETGKDLRDT